MKQSFLTSSDFLDPMGDSVGSSRLFEYDGGDGFSFEDSIFNFDGNLSSLDLDDFFIG